MCLLAKLSCDKVEREWMMHYYWHMKMVNWGRRFRWCGHLPSSSTVYVWKLNRWELAKAEGSASSTNLMVQLIFHMYSLNFPCTLKQARNDRILMLFEITMLNFIKHHMVLALIVVVVVVRAFSTQVHCKLIRALNCITR